MYRHNAHKIRTVLRASVFNGFFSLFFYRFYYIILQMRKRDCAHQTFIHRILFLSLVKIHQVNHVFFFILETVAMKTTIRLDKSSNNIYENTTLQFIVNNSNTYI